MPLRSILCLLLLAGCAAQADRASTANGEKITWPSVVCAGAPVICNRMEGAGYFFAQPGARVAVLISHGSQGLDLRLFEYADALRQAGFAALVIDHWTPRGITVTHQDYVAASLRGGNELNMAFDSLTAAAWLRSQGYDRIGSIGESQGGGAAIMLTQKFVHELVNRNVSRIYARPFATQPLDAVVGLYGYCGIRNALRDAYVATPVLFVTGAADDETPSRYCERYVPWMNARGGKADIVVLPGEGHSFDAPYRRRLNPTGPHYANCDILIDAGGVTDLTSGETMPGQDTRPLMAKCLRFGGYHSGYRSDRFVAVPHWIGFFRRHMHDKQGVPAD
ncbi:dienelactone hydrolase family protein [Ferrovibrio terrae]|uniref:dienelactone hydrolase family protein n=1 Tax=Ferrovibrio terrae TaxID=2594003 RepID=UPI003137C1E6